MRIKTRRNAPLWLIAALPILSIGVAFIIGAFFILWAGESPIRAYIALIKGSLGSTFAMPSTYPRTGTVIGFCLPEHVVEVAEKVLLVQRDNGDRQNRKQARLKYTVDRMGVENFVAEVQARLDFKIEKARSFKLSRTGDNFGWKKGSCSHITNGSYFLFGAITKSKIGANSLSRIFDHI